MARVSFAVLWVALFAAIGIGLLIGVSNVTPAWGGPTWFIARNGSYEVIAFGIATVVVGRVLNGRSWANMGWQPRTARSFGRGLVLGAAMAVAAIVLAVVLDGARVRITNDANLWVGVAAPLLTGLVLSALGEELAFRGFPLRRLADGIGVLPAMLVLAALFGVAHAGNDNATVFSTINVALAAIWLSVAFLSTGGMGLAWGAHLGWNAGLAILFDAPVSGILFHVPVVEYTPGAHAWVDGGPFGPEGGIVATLAMAGGVGYLLTRPVAFAPAATA